ncbi:MAG: type II toxin-antitoxin system HicB family antitoxin [Candidatus Omnitrophica bacterium]|nr:type II toxin-antitoxin system HicB family antitoxin [Candidatus Omnitrophota bacterium]MBU0897043.1 type II toxin-antitoxin system HicB family antitoxin [Candidatus Omnitrophota bacterium]MBU1133572.1 type II toxin-antitoxin system HicB family antitoxin [Candidatus Omnitrophota bacterium]MBU1367631.1 type II toxin-antitoxin system HicB family antitoxin [Candidatus Omnitrophota bacterium]MBU1524059.1 type II toxin-antitoxin system HicB family antitoxin [Candidatus Omnitrophota bacterium]
MHIKIILEPSEEGGYTAIVPTLPGCISEGDTREGTLKNIREAIELYMEPVEDDSIFSPSSEQVEITV